MNMVSIQGTDARSFFMDEDRRMAFHSMLHSVLDHQYLFVNSKFKSDLLYIASENLNPFFIEKLLTHIGGTADDSSYRKFYTSTETKSTLEAFFIRLYHLQQRRDWFLLYSREIKKEFQENRQNPLVKHLLGCCKKINLDAFDDFKKEQNPAAQNDLVHRHEAYFRLMDYINGLNYN